MVWCEDRSNLELDYTRNKIRNYLYSRKLFKQINNERITFSKILYLNFTSKFFKRKRYKIFEIELEKFNNLNEILKFFTVKSFYYEYRHLLQKKQIRDENIKNFIKILKVHLTNSKEMSVFSGKIGVFNKKICINLS